jgi:glycerophosphoryl diester phosphodiesterase
VVIAAVVAGVVAWPHVQRYTGVAPPVQFDEPIDARLPGGAEERVAGIAHNAGNNLGTLRAAVSNGADVVEVDVISARGHLVAGREYQPLPGLARLLFRGPTLQDAWDAAPRAVLLKLDLKQSDPAFLEQLVAFLSPRASLRPVMVSSPDRAALVRLNHRLPDVTLLGSVADPVALSRLQSDPFLVSIIGGITAFHGLVDTNLVAWAHQAGLKVIAWTVAGGRRLVQLARHGVDGITTANLAVLRELGGQRAGPSWLRQIQDADLPRSGADEVKPFVASVPRCQPSRPRASAGAMRIPEAQDPCDRQIVDFEAGTGSAARVGLAL